MESQKATKEVISILIRPQDEPALTQAREELAIGLDPLSLAQLLEAVMVACRTKPELMKAFRQRMPEIAQSATYRGDYRPSSVRLDSRVCDWLRKELPSEKITASMNRFIRFIAEDWQTIRAVLPIRAHGLVSRLK